METKKTRQYLLIGSKPWKYRNNSLPTFGDWKERQADPKDATELAHAIIDTYKANRIADEIVLRFQDGEEFSFLSGEFQNRFHAAFPLASTPSISLKGWAAILTKPKQP